MGCNLQTGLLLVLGTIAAAVGWTAFYPADENDGVVQQAKDIMANPNLAKTGILLGFGGMIAIFTGLINITRRMAMAEGPGASYANIATILAMTMIATFVIGAGIELGVAESSSAQGAVTLMGVSLAVGGSLQIVMGITLALIAIGVALDKNLHVISALTALIAGVAIFIGAFVDAEWLGFAGWIAFMVTSLLMGGSVLGVKLLKAKS
jgi:hypothetical protein